jgi:hypothetical protein
MGRVRHVPDAERRARLARRHALAPGHRVASVLAATEAMTVLHATEPATVYLSCWARVTGMSTADVDRALYDDRTVVKQLAMRRTLFVFPRDLLPAAWGSAAARTARTERTGLVKAVVAGGLAPDAPEGERWLRAACDEVLELLDAHPDGLPAAEIRTRLPRIDTKIELMGGSVPAAGRVMTLLGASGELVRAGNTGHWRVSRPHWALMRHWLDEVEEHLAPAEGYREVVRRWLVTFGPGTETDIVWWLGATKGIVRAALAELDAVAVTLDGGTTGWVLPDDLDGPPAAGGDEPWVALLPVLDPTVMGWKERDFYLGPHAPDLFDRNGNAGTTAWVDGRVVGCWTQDPGGTVRVHLLEDVTAGERRALETEAARLTEWLDGLRVGTVYPSPAMKTHRDAETVL